MPGMHAIEISASVDKGWLRLVVRDDGCGMPFASVPPLSLYFSSILVIFEKNSYPETE